MSTYTQENLMLACRAIARGMSGVKASNMFKVPRTTLYRRMQKGQFGDKLKKGGRTKLADSEEQRLIDWYVQCKQMGFITSRRTRICVEGQKILSTKNPLNTEKLGKDWLRSLIERHRKLRDALKTSIKKKYFDKSALELWFKGIETFFKEHQMMEVLEKPSQLYYCCKLQLTDNVKVMLSYSAQGMATPPMLVYENVKEDYQLKNDFDSCVLPKGWVKYESKNFKNQNPTYTYYLQNVLYSYLQQQKIPQPIFIFMDFQNNPTSLELYELCNNMKMFIINSYPMAFKLTQDVQTKLTENIKKSTINTNLNSYLEILKNILTSQLTKENMCLNFSNCGIYPFDFDKANINIVPVLYPIEEPENLEELETDISDKVLTNARTTNKSDTQLSFNEFQSMLSSDMKNKLELSLYSTEAEECNTLEFNILLKIYRKFCENTDIGVAIENEPILEDPLNDGYVVDEMDEAEDIKPFDQLLIK